MCQTILKAQKDTNSDIKSAGDVFFESDHDDDEWNLSDDDDCVKIDFSEWYAENYIGPHLLE